MPGEQHNDFFAFVHCFEERDRIGYAAVNAQMAVQFDGRRDQRQAGRSHPRLENIAAFAFSEINSAPVRKIGRDDDECLRRVVERLQVEGQILLQPVEHEVKPEGAFLAVRYIFEIEVPLVADKMQQDIDRAADLMRNVVERIERAGRNADHVGEVDVAAHEHIHDACGMDAAQRTALDDQRTLVFLFQIIQPGKRRSPAGKAP